MAAGPDQEARRARARARSSRVVSPDGKRSSTTSPSPVASTTQPRGHGRRSRPRPTCSRSPAGSGQTLRLDLFAPPLDRTRRLLVALASGLAALLAGAALLIWAASRWLVAPLRRLNAQVDAIAGGDPIETRATSPIREVENVATAVAGMAARLAQTAEHDARLEAERRLLVSSIAHDLRTPLFSLRGYLDAIATGIGNPRERLDRARAKAEQIDRLVTACSTTRGRTSTSDLGCRRQTSQRRSPTRPPPSSSQPTSVESSSASTAHTRPLGDDRPRRLRTRTRQRPRQRAAAHAARRQPSTSPAAKTPTVPSSASSTTVPASRPTSCPASSSRSVRADTRNGRTDGAGLGLTIAARLLRNQGGTIDAANAPGRGAILTLRLPRKVE